MLWLQSWEEYKQITVNIVIKADYITLKVKIKHYCFN